MSVSVPPSTRVSPSPSMMVVVAAVSLCPTCGVPVIVGAPVAGVFGVASSTLEAVPVPMVLIADTR